MTNNTGNIPSPHAEKALRSLGENLRVARLNRRISMRGLAERMGVSERTVSRLEKGECGVGIGTLAMACLVLGEIDRITHFLDVASDEMGIRRARQNPPKRIRECRSPALNPTDDHGPSRAPEANSHGMAF